MRYFLWPILFLILTATVLVDYFDFQKQNEDGKMKYLLIHTKVSVTEKNLKIQTLDVGQFETMKEAYKYQQIFTEMNKEQDFFYDAFDILIINNAPTGLSPVYQSIIDEKN